jgi:hypothetical protein
MRRGRKPSPDSRYRFGQAEGGGSEEEGDGGGLEESRGSGRSEEGDHQGHGGMMV